MEAIKCDECSKIIEGYNLNHAQSLLKQHKLKHENDRRKEQEEK